MSNYTIVLVHLQLNKLENNINDRVSHTDKIILPKRNIFLTYDIASEMNLFLDCVTDGLYILPPGERNHGGISGNAIGHLHKHRTQVLLSGRIIVQIACEHIKASHACKVLREVARHCGKGG
jgi:hypothetical protein